MFLHYERIRNYFRIEGKISSFLLTNIRFLSISVKHDCKTYYIFMKSNFNRGKKVFNRVYRNN